MTMMATQSEGESESVKGPRWKYFGFQKVPFDG